MDTKPVCCNFQRIGEAESYFKPYSMVTYGNVDVAYIGITTPETITCSSPSQFKDENGEHIYTFNATMLYDIVQNNIDLAKAKYLTCVFFCFINSNNSNADTPCHGFSRAGYSLKIIR